ncbi:hypothetical protein [Pectobacterium sp. B1J-3]|uniref:hypothetical protein n=1 Tax=Pectobacterium sp. B1J-3 TaxID=3385371 RepID=UPI003906AE09
MDGYNLGYLVNNDLRRVNPPEDWAFTVIDAIFESLRQSKITEQPRYYLFGNSAGCQFVHRMLTFVPTAKVKAAICAAAGWWTLPDDETTWPYGFANAPVVLKTTELERYFAMPLLITVGQRDNDPYHPLLRRSYEAMAQGNNRLQRAENYFLTGKQKASRYKFPFNWQFTTVPDVAHSGSKMSAWAATQFVQFEKSGAFPYQY